MSVTVLSSKYVIVFVTVGKSDEAHLIGRKLVEKSLAACVGFVQQQSIYRWKGEIVEDKEILLIIKTRRELFGPLREMVLSLHSYDVPEIIALDIQDGHGAYLDWIEANTTKEMKAAK